MKLTAKEISTLVEGKLYGNPEVVVTGAAGLEDASESDISFLGNLKYTHLVKETKAGVIFLPEKMEGLKQTIIVVKNPQLAFAKVLTVMDREKKSVIEKGIHSTAIIGKNVKLGHEITIGPYVVIEDDVCIGNSTKILAQAFVGANSKIGYGCLIHPGVKIKENASIGNDCIIYPNVTVRDNVVIGNNCIIHPGAVLGADGFGFVPTENGHFKIPQIGEVEIGDDVEIGANVTIDRGTTGKTKIGKGTKIDNLVMIAHNVHIGEHCLIVSQTGISGSTKVGNFVTFGGQAGTVGHIKIGDGAIIGAQAGVISDIKAKEFVSGYPARPHKEAMKKLSIIEKLPEIYEYYRRLITKNKKNK